MLNALKRRIARFMASRNYVKHLVREELERGPEFYDYIRAHFQNSSVSFNQLLKDGDFFRSVLRQHATNPEALFTLLATRGVIDNVALQTAFLSELASNPATFDILLARLPKEQRHEMLRQLLQHDPIMFDDFPADSAEIWASLVARTAIAERADPDEQFAIALAPLRRHLADNMEEFVRILAAEHPHTAVQLLKDRGVRRHLLQQLAAETDGLNDLMQVALFDSNLGKSQNERVGNFLGLILKQPSVRAALLDDGDVRKLLEHTLEDVAVVLGTEKVARNG